jgi:hypothetical protein
MILSLVANAVGAHSDLSQRWGSRSVGTGGRLGERLCSDRDFRRAMFTMMDRVKSLRLKHPTSILRCFP